MVEDTRSGNILIYPVCYFGDGRRKEALRNNLSSDGLHPNPDSYWIVYYSAKAAIARALKNKSEK